jgi:hypothetical protein
MTPARIRARAVPAAGLLAVLLSVPAWAGPSPSPTPEPEDPIRVDVTQILPRSPQPGSAVEVSGTLRNTGSVTVTNLRVRLQVGEPIGTRSELQQADDDRPPTSSRAFVEPVLTTLAPGQAAAFTVRTNVRELGLRQLGVYPLDVVARGNAGDGMDSLGLTPTWLPYFKSPPRPIRVAVVWPLVDVSHLRPDGTLLDDDLPSLLAPSGRLGRLLAVARTAQVPSCEAPAVSAAGVPDPRPTRCDPVLVTFAVDPDLLDAVQTLASSSAAGNAVASSWLDQLRGAGLDGRVLALPYADPDVSALAHDPRTKDDVANASALASEVVSQVLQTSSDTAVAWPPPGPVTPAAADALALSGARSFVLDPSAYDDSGRLGSLTPSTHALFTTSATGAELNGLVVDPALSELLTRTTPYGSRITEQRFLAETAIVSAEKPGVTRTLVLAPPRRTDVPLAAREELRDLGRVPWLCPVSLGAVAAGQESCERESSPPGPPGDRGDLRNDTSDELGAGYLRSVAADRDLGTQLTDAVVAPTSSVRTSVAALKGRLRRAVARAESSAGRDEPGVTQKAAALLHHDVDRLAGQVLVRGGRSLLTSTKGTLSVSVENTLSLPVQVRVRFTSKTATLTNAETGLVTIQPGHAVQATVHARAQRSGQFVVFAQLVDRDGGTFGPEAEIIVRSTRFGRLALALTLAAMGVLLVAAGVRITRRIRAARS